MLFSEIKGHDSIKFFLKKAIGIKQVANSYLFSGPEAVGKTLTAVTFAKALNCLDAKDDACGACVSCVKIENKNHPDIMFIKTADKKDSISIEQIRDLQETANLRPYEARAKVFIIQGAHLMSEAAANCLLKTLEEPPRDCVIILITSRPDALLLTIKSRCRQIGFAPLGLKTRIELSEKIGLSKDGVEFLSRVGAMEFAFLAEDGKDVFDYKNRVLAEFTSDKSLLDETSFIFSESKESMKFMISVLGSWFRDILLLKTAASADLLINFDRAAELKEIKDGYGFEELGAILSEIQFANFCLERNVGPKLALNDLKLKIQRKAVV